MSTPPRSTPQLQQIAFTIRDWLGPFYTLGGVTAFVIFLLSLLDPSGRLLQGVQIVLLLASALALAAAFLLRNRLGPLAQRFFASHGHWILCLISAFFACGLVISHWIHRERPEPFVSPPPVSTKADAPGRSVKPEPEPAPTPVVPPAPVPAPAPAPAPVPAPAPAAAATPAAPRPVDTAPARKPAPPTAAPVAPPPAARPERQAATPAQRARCTRLVQRMGLGETLSGEELDELRRSCGS